ncbi:translation initiation factor IF-2 [Bacillota bacterium LX-D]|nr:translation initiation factor IF-2 [Bacillota bacterium LX-D]
MSKLRVYELAKEKKINTKELVWILGKLGVEVKSHMSTIDEKEIALLENYLNSKDKDEKKSTEDLENKNIVKNENLPKNNDKDYKANEKSGDLNLNNKRGSNQRKDALNKNNSDHKRAEANKSQSNKDNNGVNSKVNNRVQNKVNNNMSNNAPKEDTASRAVKYVDNDKNFEPKKQIIKKRTSDDKKNTDFRNRRKKNDRKKHEPAPKPDVQVIKKVTLGESIVVQDFAKKIGKTASDIIKKLIGLGVMATVNQEIDLDTATLVAAEYGIEVEFKTDKPMTEIEEMEDAPESLKERPPVVTVMGHVDHGKTSLLDAIRKSNVTATEAGGITQHIGAYQVEINKRKLTFLDTPGHEAFTAMRARGAQATDIAILVVAADDGVMPQTIEAINHAKAAEVPIIVAINKIDRPNAAPERVKQELAEYGLISEEWGGDTLFVEVSALKKQGISELLEMILLVADMSELKANPNRLASGVVIEAKLDKGRGPVATILVQKGTLHIGDIIVSGTVFGKVRAMMDDKGNKINGAGPSVPVEVLGLSNVPEAGDIFQAVEDEKLAREVVNQRQIVKRQEELQKGHKVTLDDLFDSINAGELKELNIILKADVQGSVEALKQSLEGLNTDEVKVNVIHNGVGAITETDVMLASASNAIIIGFNVRPDSNTRKAAENEQVDIKLYRVIYEAIDNVKAALSGLLDPEWKENVIGRAEVRQIFKVPKVGTVAGSYVTDGKITNKSKIRVIRDGIVIHEGEIESLRRFKDDVKEVSQGFECGLGLQRFNDIKEGDVFEAYVMEEVKRELD